MSSPASDPHHQALQPCPLDTDGANLVAHMAKAPNSSDAMEPALVAGDDHLVAPLVAPVSLRTIPGFVDPSADVVGSGSDVVDGDDPHWGPRAA